MLDWEYKYMEAIVAKMDNTELGVAQEIIRHEAENRRFCPICQTKSLNTKGVCTNANCELQAGERVR